MAGKPGTLTSSTHPSPRADPRSSTRGRSVPFHFLAPRAAGRDLCAVLWPLTRCRTSDASREREASSTSVGFIVTDFYTSGKQGRCTWHSRLIARAGRAYTHLETEDNIQCICRLSCDNHATPTIRADCSSTAANALVQSRVDLLKPRSSRRSVYQRFRFSHEKDTKQECQASRCRAVSNNTDPQAAGAPTG